MFKNHFITINHDNIFSALKKYGEKTSTHNFTIISSSFNALKEQTPIKHLKYAKCKTYIAIKATVKAFDTAVKRNKIKRQTRNIVYEFLKHYPSKQHAFIVIIPKSYVSTKKFATIKSDLFFGLRKLFRAINIKGKRPCII